MTRSFHSVFMIIFLMVLSACTIGIEYEVPIPTVDQSSATPDLKDRTETFMKKTPDLNQGTPASRTVQPKKTIPPPDELQPIENFEGVNRVMVESAIAEASQKSGVSPDRIKVLKAEAVEWRDSSLGCPKPGMMYLQVLSDGYQVILDVDGELFDYRSGRDGKLYLCENPSP